MSTQKGKNKLSILLDLYYYSLATYANYTNYLVKALNDVCERKGYDVTFQSYSVISPLFLLAIEKKKFSIK